MRRRAFLTLVAVSVAAAAPVLAQQEGHDGMERGGALTIENDAERRLFGALLCTCGTCSRETLSVCTCTFAAERREEIRAMLRRGMSEDEIRAKYVKEFGTGALAIPPNEGKASLLYLAPLAAIAVGAGVVVTALRRFRGKAAAAPAEKPAAKAGPDAYDEKLDRELRELDE